MSVLSMLVDDARALPVLAPHATHLLGSALELAGVRILRAWRRTWTKPAQKHREYLDLYLQLHGRSACGATMQVGIHGIAGPGAALPDAGRYSRRLTLPDALLCYERLPFDRHLPSLATLMTTRGCAHALTIPALRQLGGTPDQVTLISFRAGQRAVLRASRGASMIYGKVHAGDQHAAHALRLAMLQPSVTGVLDGPTVPPLLGHNAQHGVIWLAELPGRNAGDLLLESTATRALRTALGHALARWHRLLPPPALGTQTRSELLVQAERKLRKLGNGTPALIPASMQLAQCLRQTLPLLPVLPPSLIHGDVHPAQFLIDEARHVGLCDLDEIALGDPERDLAQLCERIGDGGILDGWEQGAARPLNRPLHAWHLALAHVDRAYRDYSSGGTVDGPALSRRLHLAYEAVA